MLEQSLFKLLHGSPDGRNNTPDIQGKKGRRIRDRRVFRRCACNRATCGGSEDEGWLVNVTPNSSERVGYFFWETLTTGRVDARELWWENEESVDRRGTVWLAATDCLSHEYNFLHQMAPVAQGTARPYESAGVRHSVRI